MPKKIVLCCDGTWNSPDFQQGTNVWKFYNYLANNDYRQVKYYDTGVGTRGFIDRFTGGLAGEGLVDNIFEAYRFICSHYEQGAEIFLFGFSRGAYTVRAVAGVLHDAGVLLDGFTCLRNHYKDPANAGHPELDYHHNCFDVQLITESNDNYDMSEEKVCTNCRSLFNSVNKVKEIYKNERKKTYNEYKLHIKQNKGRQFKPAGDSKLQSAILAAFPGATFAEPSIHTIGVWDTISALGIPSLGDVFKTRQNISRKILNGISNIIFKSSRRQYAFINDQLTPIVKHAFHALALDEQRDIFKPVLWDGTLSGKNQTLVQEWFIGAHANVGGGYEDHTLSDIPLKWMIAIAKDEARGNPLIFDTEYDKYIHPNHLGLHHLSHLDFPYKYLPKSLRILPKPRKVNNSVYLRMAAGLRYAPENVFT